MEDQLAMDGEERASGKTVDPDQRRVELLARIWESKIVRDHPEVAGYLEDVLNAVRVPSHVEDDPRPHRRRYYRKDVGPSNWLLVVVSYEQEPARIVTALATRKDPKQWQP